MSEAIWPASLPQEPLVDGFSESPADVTIRSELNNGITKTRQRFSGGAESIRVRYDMSEGQLEIFREFERFTLQNRSLPFTHTHPRDFFNAISTAFGSCLKCSVARKSYAEVADDDVLSFTNNIFTFEFWLKANSTNAEISVISKMDAAGHEYQIWKPAGDNVLFFQAYDGAYASIYNDVANGVIPDDDWHHWAWAADGSNAKLYRDGVLLGTVAKSAGNMGNTSNKLHIGRAGTTTLYYTDGFIDEVRVFSDERTPAEISGNMSTPLVGNETGLVALWQFNEGSGISADDATINNLDAVLYNARFSPELRSFKIAKSTIRAKGNSNRYTVTLDLEMLP